MLSTADFERGELAAVGTICEQGFKLTYYPAAAVLSELRRRLLARCKTFINGASLTADQGVFTQKEVLSYAGLRV